MRVAGAFGDLAGHLVLEQHFAEDRADALALGVVDELALTGQIAVVERRDDGEGERDRVHQVDVAAAVGGMVVRVAGDVRAAGDALVDHRVAEVLGLRTAVAAAR